MSTQPQTQNPAFALQKKQPEKPKNVLALLTNEAFKAEIAKALPKHMNADRMLRVALTTAKMSDKLQRVSVESFASKMMLCSQFGLEPDGRHAHLIPFRNGKDRDGNDIYDLNLIFDYKGIAALVRRSGDASDVTADVVYDDDYFVCERGSNSRLEHRPNLKSGNRGIENIYAIYSFVKLKDGTPSFDVMTVDEVNGVRDKSQGYIAAMKYEKQSPWVDSWREMAKKTVFRRHSKWLDISPEVRDALQADDDSEETRFKNAKPAMAEVVSPDFSLPAPAEAIELSTPAPSEQQQPGQSNTAAAQAPSSATVPNETLGEKNDEPKVDWRAKFSEAAKNIRPEAILAFLKAKALIHRDTTLEEMFAKIKPSLAKKYAENFEAFLGEISDFAIAPPPPPPAEPTRLQLVEQIRQKMMDAAVAEADLLAALYARGTVPNGSLLTAVPSDMLKAILNDWGAILAETEQN